MDLEVQKIITEMLAKDFDITTNETLMNADETKMAEMYENMKAIQEKFGLSDTEMASICDKIFH